MSRTNHIFVAGSNHQVACNYNNHLINPNYRTAVHNRCSVNRDANDGKSLGFAALNQDVD